MSLFSLPYELVELTVQTYLLRREWVALAGLHSILHEICQPLLYRVIGKGRAKPTDSALFERYGHHVREFHLNYNSTGIWYFVLKLCTDLRALHIQTSRSLFSEEDQLLILPDLASGKLFPQLRSVTTTGHNIGLTLPQLRQFIVPRVKQLRVKYIDKSVSSEDLASLLKETYGDGSNGGGGLEVLELGMMYYPGKPIEQYLIETMANSLRTLVIQLKHPDKKDECSPLFSPGVRFPNLTSLFLPGCCPDRFSTTSGGIMLNPEVQFPKVRHLQTSFSHICETWNGSMGPGQESHRDPNGAIQLVWSRRWPCVTHLELTGQCGAEHYKTIVANFPALNQLTMAIGSYFSRTGPMEVGKFINNFYFLEEVHINWRNGTYPEDMSHDRIDASVVPRIRKIVVHGTYIGSQVLADLLVSPSLREIELSWLEDVPKIVELLEQKRDEEGKVSQVTKFSPAYGTFSYDKIKPLLPLMPRCEYKLDGEDD
ncbi:hypothetical protein GQ42DRAFT_164409 [Ramicandelaber brevisporus]|nr:hypothetical protein GQ42DRAFT_164409 [Ramicandelaber brevisporus]